MSGFAGIIQLDDAPTDAQLVETMTRLAERHGGDAFNVHCQKEFAFGHSLLRTTPESATETQPFSIDGNIWILGDVRIDAREELAADLKKANLSAQLSRPDIELVLMAFEAWGEACLDHLLGDFAFVVWNRREKRLFCARDSFGVKPFYYAFNDHSFIFSNNLDSVRAHPMVSDGRNEAFVADFLVFGHNLDESTTYFADIQRLPPSHSLTLGTSAVPQLRKYSQLSFDNRIEYKNEDDYCDHFLTLFKRAVQDRLRNNSVGFELSGGMDSTSVAAVAARLNSSNIHFSAKAITTDSSKVNPQDEEASYARVVADQCGLIHETVDAGSKADFYSYLDNSQPYAWPFAATTIRFADRMRSHGRVMLSGQGADPFMHGSGVPLLDAFRSGSPSLLLKTFITKAVARKSLRGHGIRAFFNGDMPRVIFPKVPEWLDREKLDLSGSIDRWMQLFYRPKRYPHGCHSELAYDELHMPFWSSLFENYYHDLLPGIDCRHPFFDLRLINFFFAVPPQVKENKLLLRRAMKDYLPDSVLQRGKANVVGDIVQKRLLEPGTDSFSNLSFSDSSPWINEQVYRAALERYAKAEKLDRFTIVCPLSLRKWTKKTLML